MEPVTARSIKHHAEPSLFPPPSFTCPVTPVPSWKLLHDPFHDGLLLCRHAHSNTHTRSPSLADLPLTSPHPLNIVSARKLAASYRERHEFLLGDDLRDRALHLQEGDPPLELTADGHPSTSEILRRRLSSKYLQAKVSSRKPTGMPEKGEDQEAATNALDQSPLTNICDRVHSVEEDQTTTMFPLTTLQLELEDASARLQDLRLSHRSTLSEISGLLRRFREEMTTLRRTEQDRIKEVFGNLKEELEEERSTSRRLKLQNIKLARDLSQANEVSASLVEELEKERKARELMEDVCNELAREMGEDKAEVEKLKRQQEEVKETVEEARKMLRMAVLWREERVRSKLSQKELELEGKNLAIEDLKSKLEAFVTTVRKWEGTTEADTGMQAQVKQAETLRDALEMLQMEEGKEARGNEDGDEGHLQRWIGGGEGRESWEHGDEMRDDQCSSTGSEWEEYLSTHCCNKQEQREQQQQLGRHHAAAAADTAAKPRDPKPNRKPNDPKPNLQQPTLPPLDTPPVAGPRPLQCFFWSPSPQAGRPRSSNGFLQFQHPPNRPRNSLQSQLIDARASKPTHELKLASLTRLIRKGTMSG